MTNKEAEQMIDAIHKDKNFHPNNFECTFLEDMSFYVSMGSFEMSERQSKLLQQIYRKSQGG